MTLRDLYLELGTIMNEPGGPDLEVRFDDGIGGEYDLSSATLVEEGSNGLVILK